MAATSKTFPRRCLSGALGALLGGLALLAAPGPAAAAPPAPAPAYSSAAYTSAAYVGTADPADWAAFRSRFLTTDGRVIDNANGGVSHSEGQGYGMLLAAYYGDRPSFELMLAWTEKNLRRPSDHLASWRYDPVAKVHVGDPNNATDGDLYMAWALIRAGEIWRHPAYTARAAAIASDILALCVVRHNGRLLLLPGANGFRRPEGVVLNMSYYAFPALHALARAVPDPRWAEIEADGLAILRGAHFGPLALPPDWLLVSPEGKYRPADGWPARFSYDAVRIPLNLAWAHLREPALQASLTLWESTVQSVRAPAWVSLNGAEAANYPIGPGVRAIMKVGEAETRGQPAQAAVLAVSSGPAPAPSAMPAVAEATEYYQAALLLLAKMAVAEPEPELSPAPAATRLAAGASSSWSPIATAQAATTEAATEAAPASIPVAEPPAPAAPPARYASHWLSRIGLAKDKNAAPPAAAGVVASNAASWPDYAPFARPGMH